jgi:hypothetical protein
LTQTDTTAAALEDETASDQDPRAEGAAIDHRPRVLPSWFVAALGGAITAVATAGLFGVLLLHLGRYHPLVTLGAGLAAGAGVSTLTVRRARPRAAPDHVAAAAAIGIGLVFFGLAASFHSEHVLVDRDPAVYVNTGRSIARHHELRPQLRSGPFSDRDAFTMASVGFGDTQQGRLRMEFLHMLPVLLAQGWAIGGDLGLLLVGPFLGALGVLAVYALAARAVGPRWALVAPALLTVNPLTQWFARDAYSELVVLLVAVGGVWLYAETRPGASLTLAFAAGAIVGSSVAARIDAVAVVVGAVAIAVLDYLRADEHAARAGCSASRVRLGALVFLASGLTSTLVSVWLNARTAPGYVRGHRRDYEDLQQLLAACVVIAVVVVLVHRIRPGLARRVLRHPAVFGAAAAVATLVFTWAFFVRPEDGPPPPSRPRRALVRWHWSHSLEWFADWFGPVTVVLAFAGVLLLAWRAVRGNRGAAAAFLLMVPLTVLYVWKPRIGVDQPWAMRRYLPVVIPGLAVALAVLLHAIGAAAWRRRRRSERGIGVAVVALLGAGIVGPSVVAAEPLVQARTQHGAFDAIGTICDAMPRRSAVVVYGQTFVDLEWPQTVRGFCGVPVARPRTKVPLDLTDLAQRWRSEGRALFVLTGRPTDVEAAFGPLTEVAHVEVDDRYAPRRRVGDRSREYKPRRREAWLFEVPLPPAGALPQ